MKRLVLFLVGCIGLFSVLTAQPALRTAQRPDSIPSPISDRISGWLTYAEASTLNYGIVNDDDANPMELACMQRFTSTELAAYNGLQLEEVAFYLWDDGTVTPSGNYTIRVYQGGSYTSNTNMNPGTLIASQTVSNVEINDWTTVVLNSTVTIDASQELWFGVYITNGTGLLLSYDEYNTTPGKGTLYYDTDDQQWYDINAIGLSFTVGNWGIKGYAHDPSNPDIIIDLGMDFIDNPNSQTSITSMTVPYGSNFELVPVVYNFNYGAATADFRDTLHFELTLDGTPLRSTGASTVYIASGNAVYWDNFTAAYATEISQYNLYGTHTVCMTVSTGPGWYENDPSDNTACLSVTFEAPTVSNYTISVLNTDNTVSPNGNVSVSAGASQMFTITPPECSYLSDVLVDGVSVLNQVVNHTYTFTNVNANHTFLALYSSNTYTISATTDGNGSLTPAPPVTVPCGGNQTLAIIPNSGYEIDYVTDNSSDVTHSVQNSSYLLTNIQQDHQIFVAFREISGGGGGGGEVEDSTTVALSDFATQAVRLFPNPATQELTIQAASPILCLDIHDFTGRTVYQATPAASTVQVQVENLPQGIYLIQLQTASQTIIRKFVKK